LFVGRGEQKFDLPLCCTQGTMWQLPFWNI